MVREELTAFSFRKEKWSIYERSVLYKFKFVFLDLYIRVIFSEAMRFIDLIENRQTRIVRISANGCVK